MNNDDFENQTMLTCIGNKRRLTNIIKNLINTEIIPLIGKDKINIVDGFAGSSVVSRALSQYSENIHSNDLEPYSHAMAKCFMITPNDNNKLLIENHINSMNQLAENGPYISGIITEMYSPNDSQNPQKEERCFYTKENALIIDTLREYISKNVPEELFYYCITPLLIKASIHTNTCGVFKGFYKNKEGVGAFGGSDGNALERIMSPIRVEVPKWSNFNFTGNVYNKDINELIDELPDDIDLIYYDPPYNQHPYSSNYFMLNIILKNERPEKVSKVSGIPRDWTRSNYNYKKTAITSMKELINKSIEKTKYILISYNDEGIIKPNDWEDIFGNYDVTMYEMEYNTFRGSRNLQDRSNTVTEIMYLISIP